MRRLLLRALMLVAFPALAAERVFDFGERPIEQIPPGFRGTMAGPCQPGDWKVILDESAPALPPLSTKAPQVSRRAVLANLGAKPAGSQSGTCFPMLIFEGDDYRDFKFSTKFKIVEGEHEQTAGVVFHFQNESNFYVARASAKGQNFRCFKVANGEWKPPIGPEVLVSKGVWHELSVQCEGTRILCSLDGTNSIKLIDSSGNHPGKIGFTTESDSVSYFAEAKIAYAQKEILAQKLVRDALEQYPRLLGLKIYAIAPGKGPAVVASKDSQDIGQPGGETEKDVIERGTRYFGKDKSIAWVTVPLHDRNGEPIAALCVSLKSFPGQTEENAFARAQPVVQRIQRQLQAGEGLLE